MVGEVMAGHNPVARIAGGNGQLREEQEEVKMNLYTDSRRAEVARDGRPMASRAGTKLELGVGRRGRANLGWWLGSGEGARRRRRRGGWGGRDGGGTGRVGGDPGVAAAGRGGGGGGLRRR